MQPVNLKGAVEMIFKNKSSNEDVVKRKDALELRNNHWKEK